VAVLKTMRQNTTTPADHPVFVAHDGRRARRLRHAAVVVGVLAALWIVGLGVGMLGFGSLPAWPSSKVRARIRVPLRLRLLLRPPPATEPRAVSCRQT
jgi:hypothetical protein